MRSFFSRLGVLAAVFVAGCSIEHPTERDAGACGIPGTPCCRLDAGIRLDASGLSANGCGSGLSCVAGTCQACPSGQQLCNGTCVSVLDRNNCGGCGTVCMSGFDCITAGGDAGRPSCERVCPPGQNRCGAGGAGICTDLTSSVENCGACGTNCMQRNLPNVSVPACTASACAVGSCATNFSNCDMNAANGCEVNTQTDVAHCGGCGRACVVPPNATAVCRGGTCDFTCMAGFSDCDRNPTNGCEVNLNTDPANCMACARQCPTQPGQTATCTAGVCGTTTTLMCPAGRGDCNTMAGDGCEESLLTGSAGMTAGSIANCGACGRTCSFANAPAQCLAGTCVIGACVGTNRNCDGDQANGCEVNINTATANCGGCGMACFYPNGSPACMNGVCALASCNTNFANCNNMASDGCEIDTSNNPSHCGGCGRACAAGEQCITGTCRLICPTGQTNCSGRCVDLRSDLANCGVCGTRCAPGQVCSDAVCTTSCGAGLTNCTGTCRDLTSDRANCGACGTTCGAGQVCVNRACVLSCPTGQTACNNTFCANLTNDAANCNACGTSCAGRFANSTASCVGSACVLGACTGTFANCDSNNTNGCETQTATSTDNCGSCGNRCTFPNAAATCTNGRCGLGACASGFGDCDGIAENGCETNLNTSVNHCMRCGNVCTTMVSGLVPRCSAGVCGTQSGTCNAGTGDCDGNSGNGCETDTNTNLSNCGACGAGCSRPNAAVSCTSGVCILGACGAGFGNCDGDAVNGCETNTNTSTTHCGGCGRPCFFANAAATCNTGTCALGACATNFANCDSNASNGCEASLQSDRNNCGACNRQCASGEVCSAGVCTLMCQTGQTNCSGSCVNTSSDRANCGACGTACAAGRICQGSTCVLSCPSGQTACGSTCVNTQTDAANCNGCGTICTGGRICSSGSCVCPSGQTLCGSVCVDTQTNNSNCGMCGRTCTNPQVCSAGSCVTTCTSGTTNCSGSCINTSTSTSNCGACGTVCSLANATNTCSGGSCGISSCNTNFANCDSMSGNGCETNITNTATSCGGCGNNCNALPGVTSASCTSGLCASLVCMGGRGNCDSNASNGCESTLATDVTNCGTCGTNCNNLDQVATATCGGSACSITTCNAGFGNCDSMVGNGCETNTNTSTMNCSACGVSCPSSGGNTLNNTCLSGRCNCSAGFLDCDSNRTNGCESNRFTDTNNCGQCGVACTGGTPACVFGTCQATGCGADGQPCCTSSICAGGLACVSGNCTNNCGANGQPCCNGTTCNGGLSCNAGTCMP